MGRRSKFTPERCAAIVKALQNGNYYDVAARLAGIGSTTLFRWLEKGELQQRGAYREFRNECLRARAAAEARNVAIVQKAGAGHDVVKTVTVTRAVKPKKGEAAAATVTETTTTTTREFDWRAASWWLERSNPKRWRLRASIDVDARELLAKLLGCSPEDLPDAGADGAG